MRACTGVCCQVWAQFQGVAEQTAETKPKQENKALGCEAERPLLGAVRNVLSQKTYMAILNSAIIDVLLALTTS